MSKRLKRNAPLLKSVSRSAPRRRKEFIKCCPPDFIHCISEICLNVLKGNVPLTPCQYKKLKRQKNVIRQLADKKKGLINKRRALTRQSGGFLFPLLASVVAPVIGDLVGSLIRK